MKILQAAICAVAIGLGPAQALQTSATSQTATKPTNVLFLCPHGAAKSVLASAYFQRLAKERGLEVRVDSAGTDPDPAVGAAVADHLTQNGYPIPVSKPRRVTVDDMQKADVVVSLGCDLKDVPPGRGKLLTWNDVPGPSENFAGATETIRKHAEALVEELVRATR